VSRHVTASQSSSDASLLAATQIRRALLQNRLSNRYREPHHAVTSSLHAIVEARLEFLPEHTTGRFIMNSINEALKLFMRQAQLERAMKQPGGARVIEEQELHAVRRKLAAYPEAVQPSAEVKGNDRA
jgi:hypothetical protein